MAPGLESWVGGCAEKHPVSPLLVPVSPSLAPSSPSPAPRLAWVGWEQRFQNIWVPSVSWWGVWGPRSKVPLSGRTLLPRYVGWGPQGLCHAS